MSGRCCAWFSSSPFFGSGWDWSSLTSVGAAEALPACARLDREIQETTPGTDVLASDLFYHLTRVVRGRIHSSLVSYRNEEASRTNTKGRIL